MNIKSIGIVTAVGAAAVAIGTGIAAAQPDDGEGTPITGEALTKASQAALAFTGGGTVTGTEVGDEESLLRGRGDARPTAVRSMSSSTTPSRWSVARPTGPARTPNPTRPATRPTMNADAGRRLVTLADLRAHRLRTQRRVQRRVGTGGGGLHQGRLGIRRDAPTSACPSRRTANASTSATPTFSHPTPITNPLHPTSQCQAGHLWAVRWTASRSAPRSRCCRNTADPLRGKPVDTAIIQYVAYLDGRIHEVAIDWYAQADDGSVWYFGEDVSNYEDGKVADTEWHLGSRRQATSRA